MRHSPTAQVRPMINALNDMPAYVLFNFDLSPYYTSSLAWIAPRFCAPDWGNFIFQREHGLNCANTLMRQIFQDTFLL